MSFHYNQMQILVERMAKQKDYSYNFEGNEISDPPVVIFLEKVKICPGLSLATAPPCLGPPACHRSSTSAPVSSGTCLASREAQ